MKKKKYKVGMPTPTGMPNPIVMRRRYWEEKKKRMLESELFNRTVEDDEKVSISENIKEFFEDIKDYFTSDPRYEVVNYVEKKHGLFTTVSGKLFHKRRDAIRYAKRTYNDLLYFKKHNRREFNQKYGKKAKPKYKITKFNS